MKVEIDFAAEMQILTLRGAIREKVDAWIDRLKRYDTDASVRRRVKKLENMEDTYMLTTSADFVIFFTLKGDTITVIDVASKRTLRLFAEAAEDEPR